MRTSVKVVGLIWLLLLGRLLSAQELAIGQLHREPKVEDFAGMRPPGDLLEELSVVEGFIQRFPDDKKPATQETRVYLGYDQEHLHVVFLCLDKEPKLIRAGLARHDEVGNDDLVQMYLDTFGDRRRSYLFEVNALGIQRDSIWTEGKASPDRSFDTVWTAEGRLTPEGYVVAMSIPFRSLRFDPHDEAWRVLFARKIPRSSETAYWPYLSKDVEGYLVAAAPLRGLAGISPGRNIQLIPYAAGRSVRIAGGESGTEWDGGLDMKFVLHDQFALDLTVNPDFAQVEGDDVVPANRRFELLAAEHRPFFKENSSYFSTPLTLVHTRRIGEPQAGARLTGKAGKYTVATLLVDDLAPGRLLADDNPHAGDKAGVGILRVNRDILKNSTVGLLATSREFGGGFNRVVSADTRLAGDIWTFTAQGARSSTEALGGQRLDGDIYDLVVTRTGDLFYYGEIEQIEPGFRSALGFIPRTDFALMTHAVNYQFHPESEKLQGWGIGGSWGQTWNAARDFRGSGWTLQADFQFPKATYLLLLWNEGKERLTEADYPGVIGRLDLPSEYFGVLLNSDRFQRLGIQAWKTWGRDINYVPVYGQAPFSGRIDNTKVTLIWRPIQAFRADATYTTNRLYGKEGQAFQNEIARAKLAWQITRQLSLRTIVQWDALDPDPTLTALPPGEHLNVDVLLVYQLQPSTGLYVGYNSDLRGPGNVPPETEGPRGLEEDARRLFAKVSYLLRF